MSVRFEATQRTVLAICPCGARELWLTQAQADRWARAHLETCSLEAQKRASALSAARARHHRNHRQPPVVGGFDPS